MINITMNNQQMDDCLDRYNVCKRSALRAISDHELTSYQRKRRYRDEIFACFATGNYEKSVETISQIGDVIRMTHKT